ncbi:hypothetical protein HFD88_005548 [Aspergillus terreus]|nr:hypothetical protein HFD88_005548 [Aspergillus terreus]
MQDSTLEIKVCLTRQEPEYITLSDDELTKFTGAYHDIIAKSRSIDPTQLAEVLDRLRRVGIAQSWTVSSTEGSIKSSSPSIKAASDATSMRDTCRRYAQNIGSSDIPVGRGGQTWTRQDGTVAQAVDDRRDQPGRTVNGEMAQATDQSCPNVKGSALGQRHGSSSGDSRRKRRRTTGLSPLQVPATTLGGTEEPQGGGSHTDRSASPTSLAVAVTSFKGACGLAKAPCLGERELSQVFSLSTRLIVSDPGTVLRPLLASWQVNVAQGAHALGLPLEWKGVNAAGVYTRLLRDDAVRDGVGQRVARMLLVLNYTDICKHPEVHCPRRVKGKAVAHVIDCIARAYLDDTSRNPSKRDRDAIHHFLRQGRWLWTLVRQVGIGFVLACSAEVIKNVSIRNAVVDAVAAHTVSTRPGVVRLLSSMEPMVMALMFGRLHSELFDAVKDDESAILGLPNLRCINQEDQALQPKPHGPGGDHGIINMEAAVRPRRRNVRVPNVWQSIFKSEEWLNAIIDNYGANPVLIGPSLDQLGLPPDQRKDKIVYALLHTADLSGDVKYITSDRFCPERNEDTLFFHCLRDGYKYSRPERKITFADIGVVLNICEPIENIETVPLRKDLMNLVESNGEKLQSQYSFFAEKKIKIVESPEIISLGGPIFTSSGIGPVLALNLAYFEKRLQFIFQETEDCGWSVATMEDGVNYANHTTIVSAFQLKP